jgi:outer membrane protein assembly factor BamB
MHHRSRVRARLAVALLFAVIAAGCSASGGSSGSKGPDAASTSTGPAATKTATGWTRKDLKPISQPVSIAGVDVLYVGEPDGAHLTGLDPATGRTEWDEAASPSSITPGVAPTVAAVGRHVGYLKATGGEQEATVTALDAGTGKEVWHGDQGYFSDWPAPCFDDPASICTTGIVDSDKANSLRYDGDTGERTAITELPGGGNGRAIAAGLYDTDDRDPEVLAATTVDGVSWTKPLAEIVAIHGASTDNGWNVDRLPDVGMFVGSINAGTSELGGGKFRSDLAQNETTAFRITDGTVAWRDAGSIYGCNLVPCPGAPTSSPTEGGVPTKGVRLRMTGVLTGDANSTPDWTADGKIVLEGFDLKTGRSTWTYDAGHADALLDGSTFPRTDAATIVVPTGDHGLVAIDLASGRHKTVTARTDAWCGKETKYKVSPPFDNGSTKISEYTGADALVACGADGKPAARPKTVPSWVGASGAGMVVWSQPSAVVAARTGG